MMTPVELSIKHKPLIIQAVKTVHIIPIDPVFLDYLDSKNRSWKLEEAIKAIPGVQVVHVSQTKGGVYMEIDYQHDIMCNDDYWQTILDLIAGQFKEES